MFYDENKVTPQSKVIPQKTRSVPPAAVPAARTSRHFDAAVPLRLGCLKGRRERRRLARGPRRERIGRSDDRGLHGRERPLIPVPSEGHCIVRKC